METATQNGEVQALGGDISNAGAKTIEIEIPYTVSVTISGVCPILFHRWQSDAVEAMAKTAKGSTGRKSDNHESYVWRDDSGTICLPGEYLRGTLINPQNGAAKYRQDPRSPRKSALDLYKASVLSLTELAPIHRADGSLADAWDYIDRRRVTVQRAGITRERPALNAGWSATVILLCQSPAYISPGDLLNTL